MKLQQRLKALEKQAPPENAVTMIVVEVVRPTPDGPAPGDPVIAHVLSTPTRTGISLRRNDGETADAFLARAEVERFRVHGPEKGQPKERQA